MVLDLLHKAKKKYYFGFDQNDVKLLHKAYSDIVLATTVAAERSIFTPIAWTWKTLDILLKRAKTKVDAAYLGYELRKRGVEA